MFLPAEGAAKCNQSKGGLEGFNSTLSYVGTITAALTLNLTEPEADVRLH